MHKMVLLRFGKRRLHLLRLLGAFIIVGSALMFLSNVFQMFILASVFQEANLGNTQMGVLNLHGWEITQPIVAGDVNMQTGLFLVPLANSMFWISILLVGGVIYQAGNIILPTYMPKQPKSSKPAGLKKTAKRKKRRH